MPYINNPSSLPRFVDICQRVPPALALPRCGLKRRTPRTRANRAAAASQVVTIWPISTLSDMCSTMHLSVVKFRCFGSGWVIRRYMFRGVSGLLHWVMKGSLGFLADGTPGASGAGGFGFGTFRSNRRALRPHPDKAFFSRQQSWRASVECVPPNSATSFSHSVRWGKQGSPHLTRCHVLVVCNYARRPNLLLSLLFFSCGMDKCWRSLSADQLVI